MIRGALRLALAGAGISYAIDRVLAKQSAGDEPEPIKSMVVIDAPIERVWDAVADIEGQPRWMHDMKAVRLQTTDPIGVGTVAEADVRILGISVTDPVHITEFDPPYRFRISHDGSFKGHGQITLEAGADGTTTIVRWDETLIAPLLPHVWARLATPVLGSIFQADILRLRDLVEAGD